MIVPLQYLGEYRKGYRRSKEFAAQWPQARAGSGAARGSHAPTDKDRDRASLKSERESMMQTAMPSCCHQVVAKPTMLGRRAGGAANRIPK